MSMLSTAREVATTASRRRSSIGGEGPLTSSGTSGTSGKLMSRGIFGRSGRESGSLEGSDSVRGSAGVGPRGVEGSGRGRGGSDGAARSPQPARIRAIVSSQSHRVNNLPLPLSRACSGNGASGERQHATSRRVPPSQPRAAVPQRPPENGPVPTQLWRLPSGWQQFREVWGYLDARRGSARIGGRIYEAHGGVSPTCRRANAGSSTRCCFSRWASPCATKSCRRT